MGLDREDFIRHEGIEAGRAQMREIANKWKARAESFEQQLAMVIEVMKDTRYNLLSWYYDDHLADAEIRVVELSEMLSDPIRAYARRPKEKD